MCLSITIAAVTRGLLRDSERMNRSCMLLFVSNVLKTIQWCNTVKCKQIYGEWCVDNGCLL